jgi:G3E family GTPase
VPTIPFTVIGGFLGAGKTTLLNRWLAQADGLRIVALVNDFGAINIDATLVAQRGATSIALSNGCVCCTIGDDLTAALGRVLAAEPPFDAVVVEASGVGDPWRIAQFALVEPRLVLAGVLVLVDSAAVLAQAADPLLASSLATPLKHADLVLLNKADRADAEQLAAVRAWVAQAAGAVPVLETVQADVPLHALLQAGGYQARGGWPRGGLQPAASAHDQRFESCTWQPAADARFDEPRLRAWLRGLPPGVLRLKGWVHGAQRGWLELQYAGRHGTLRPASAAPPEGAALVAIGLAGQLPRQALATGLQACQVEPAEQAAIPPGLAS